ncbi:MAG: aldehyde dehydrogenase family protein [Clostridiales Family XIII bacterium]|jgi:acyl-CoA reductase-like NAD-dependent aldehyde dehydrogenase|nr:aldehyde dehydrogenase family protein [Clostridiales Family XIII bacterium]
MAYRYKILIDGKLTDALSGETMEVINPANNTVVDTVPKCGPADVDLAVAAAQRARAAWRGTYVGERSELLIRLAAILREHEAELIPLETAQYGGPISKTSKFDIPFAPAEFEFIAGLGRGLTGLTISGDPNARLMTFREPCGVVGLITPWNFPLVTAVSKLAPALITGNTVVLKPASCAPLTVLKLGEYIIEAGIPAGVVNIVTGPGPSVGEAIVNHPGIDKINFTGDSGVGKRIMSLASSRVMPVASELGGKNAMIVLDDANLDAAVEGATYAAFFNSGQNCGSPSRFYVQEGIYDAFLERFVRSASKIIVGDPTDPKTMMGPLAYNACRDTAERFIAGAKAAGAKVLLGGERPTSPDMVNGAFVMPTIFEVYDNRMDLMQEEIFAPVVGVMKIKTPEEAAALTNDSRYGLCASVWSADYRKALLLTEELKVGTAWVNQHLAIVSETPWGGQKESGWTKENSILVLEEYTYHKHLWINMAETPNTFWKDYISLS